MGASKKARPFDRSRNKDFAFTAQELAYEITHKPAPDTTELIDKPADKAKQKAWEIAFRDAYHLALMILESTKAEQREARAGLIASDLAAAGFITEALDLAGKLPDENKKFIYDTVTQTPKNASAEQIKLVSTFFARHEASPGDHPFLDKLTDRSGDYARLLGKSKLIAALEPTLAKYKKDADYLEGLAEILVFEPGSRVAISDWLWTADKSYLFEILSSDYFVEPGYGGKQFADAAGQARALTMAADMPWVYSYKQKYYTDFLVNLGKKHKIEIAAPASLKFNDLKKWLDAETEDIGAALAAEFPNSSEKITDAYENIADIYFFHVDRGDVTPDLAGKLGHLPAAEPALMRLKSDCDVLATYATRLLRSAGFTPVGYMAIMPTKGVGHAVALLKKAPPAEPAAAGGTPKQPLERYYIVNNKQVTANDAATKEKAIQAMRDDALKIYDPVPDAYKVCYDDAATNGAMTQAVWTLGGKHPPQRFGAGNESVRTIAMSDHRTSLPKRNDQAESKNKASHSGQRASKAVAPWFQALQAAKSQTAPAAVNQVLQSPGEALDEKSRAVFEPRFGHDFARVRIHTDQRAAQSADALHADAYTAGGDIVFGAGRYQPHSERGRTLLAHELAHVAQQSEWTRPSGGFQLSRPESVAERAAEMSAQRIAAGLDPSQSAVAHPGVVYRTIKDDLREAIAGWGTDEEAIYTRLATADADEKTAVLSDPVLMDDLYDDLSRSEWGKVLGLLGASGESRVHAASEGWGTDEEAIYDALRASSVPDLKRQIQGSTMLLQLRDELSDDELGKALAIIAEKILPRGSERECRHLSRIDAVPRRGQRGLQPFCQARYRHRG